MTTWNCEDFYALYEGIKEYHTYYFHLLLTHDINPDTLTNFFFKIAESIYPYDVRGVLKIWRENSPFEMKIFIIPSTHLEDRNKIYVEPYIMKYL